MPQQATVISEILGRHDRDPANLIMILQDIQGALRHVPDEAVDAVAAHLGVPRSRVHSTVSFYKAFTTTPRGKHQVDVCMGTACHVRGAERIATHLAEELGIETGGTTDDLEVSLDTVHCVGACALGPVVVMDGEFHGGMTPRRITTELKKCCSADAACTCDDAPAPADTTAGLERLDGADALAGWAGTLRAKRTSDARTISICAGSGCRALGSAELVAAFDEAL